MDAPPTLSSDVLAALPPAVVAFIQWQSEQMRALTARVAELEAKLGKDSTNSSKPPSTAHPHGKPLRSKSKSPRSAGGQPGHTKHERALLPTEQCHEVVRCVPTACRRCGRALTGESRPFHVLFGVYFWLLIQDPADPNVRIVGFGSRGPYEQGQPGRAATPKLDSW
jgi:hypothetical protein